MPLLWAERSHFEGLFHEETFRRQSKSVLVGQPQLLDCLAVVLPVKLDGEPVSALLDSGAGPSVVDLQTVRNLGLETRMHNITSKIFGLAQEPINVVGRLEVLLDLGNDQTVQHSFEVLNGVQNTCILGRDLLSKFGALEFDWLNHQVRVGDVWKNPHITIEGAEPLVKAYLAESLLPTYQDCNSSSSTVAGENNCTEPGFNINPGLSNQQKYKLTTMLR